MAKYTPPTQGRERDMIAASYGGPIPDASWKYLVDRRYVEELREGSLTAEDLVEELRGMNQAAPAAIHRADRRVKSLGDGAIFESINRRCGGIAEIVALRAGRDSGVRAFRQKALGDAMIHLGRVPTWISETYFRTLPQSWPGNPGPADATNSRISFLHMPKPHEELHWIDYEAETLRIWSVPPRGPLADLARLVAKLAEAWDWNPAHAVEFVLSDQTPPRPGIRRVSHRGKRGFDDRYGWYSLPAVRLTIDAQVTPEELAAWWRVERREMGVAGHRPIADGSVDLALFTVSRDQTTTWKEDCAEWNRAPTTIRRFGNWRNYRTAAIRALERLNHPAGV